MVTKQQVLDAGWGAEFHFGHCSRTVGPRGGVREHIVRARPSGAVKTWVRSPERFRLPVKHGLYDSSAITEGSAATWHLASDCPIAE